MGIKNKRLSERLVSVKTSETVRNVKEILTEHEGMSECIQDLVFSGEKLRDDLELVDCGIRQNSTLTAFVQSFSPLKLFVKVPSRRKIIEVETRSCDTIQNVKSCILEKEGIRPCSFNLIYAGKVLADDRTLASLDIQGESTLHMVITPKDTLTVSVKMPSGDVWKMEVKKLYTVRDFKTVIESIVGSSVDDLNLVCNGVHLEHSKNLSRYDITEESILEAVAQSIQIFVKDLYDRITIFDVYQEDLVITLKEKLFLKLGFPTDDQKLYFCSRSLVNDQKLAS